MGVIKINNIIYGSNLASDIIYKNTTVEEKLNAIPVFDPSDNINIEDAKYDYLTYGHIVDNLTSNDSNKILSANQGKVLKSSIDTLESNLTNAIADVRTDTENFIYNDLINIIYPIGSIYMSVNNVSPASFLGGTWEQIKDRFLLSAGSSYSAGSTGGAATHKLTTNEMPNHKHQIMADSEPASTASNAAYVLTDHKSVSSIGTSYRDLNYFNSAGGSQAHNNMPPYLTVYMWKRVS